MPNERDILEDAAYRWWGELTTDERVKYRELYGLDKAGLMSHENIINAYKLYANAEPDSKADV